MVIQTNKQTTAVVHPYHEIKLSNEWNKLLIHATTWMNLYGIMLSEENQKGYMIILIHI